MQLMKRSPPDVKYFTMPAGGSAADRAEALRQRCADIRQNLAAQSDVVNWVAQDLDALALAARGTYDAPSITPSRASEAPASPYESEVPASFRESETPSSPREAHTPSSSSRRASLRDPHTIRFDPERVWLCSAARDAFARHGVAIVRQLNNDSTLSCGFVHRIALTFALEHTGERLGRRELRAVHAAVDAGRPGSACVAHVRELAAWCRRQRAPPPVLTYQQWYATRFNAQSPRTHDRGPPTARAASARRQQRADAGADELMDAVQELVTRVRGREDALLMQDERHWSSRVKSPRPHDSPHDPELAVLRDALSAAETTIQRLSESLAAQRPGRRARRLAPATPKMSPWGSGVGKIVADAGGSGDAYRAAEP